MRNKNHPMVFGGYYMDIYLLKTVRVIDLSL